MATPHVSGAVALCASMNPAFTAGQLRNAVISTTAATASLAGITVTGGRLDIGAMIGVCAPPPVAGGKNLKITTGSIDLSWDGGTAQTGYTLLKYNTATATATLIAVGAAATSYSDAAVTNGIVYCYVLAATNPALLGLSDLECAMAGQETGAFVPGAFVPGAFSLALNQSANATMTWTTPAGGVDSYLLSRIPLNGSPITTVALGSGATSTVQATVAAGTCFQLIAFRGATYSLTDVLCGIPGVSTLSGAFGEPLALEQVIDRVSTDLSSTFPRQD